ncbi:XrtN system VIT domain-containing protein [Labilibacter marinus]|uniref:XrtN system VIT domain-containing protein n=1 Tax=Labilibacter marinus TaxID=1477105 RepID=UPI00082B0E52|nr:XrtN system VIT domain-containing protein [Labilibacter marinus]
MKTKLTPIQILGFCLLAISMVIFHYVPNTRSTLEGAALLNYPIGIVYFLLSFADRPKGAKLFKKGLRKLNWHIVLSLMMVSCFTLNKDIHVFAITPLWIKILLPITLFAFCLAAIDSTLKPWVKHATSFTLGIGLLLFGYYAIVLLPYTPIAFIGLILLGLSVHLLIPAMLIIWTLIITCRPRNFNINSKTVGIGFGAAAAFVLIYVSIYNYHNRGIQQAQKELILSEESDFPEWVSYAKNCTSPYWSERIIGQNFLYEGFNEWWSFDFNQGSFSEVRVHDPLVATAALFTQALNLSNKEQVQILSSISDNRHYTYEKLWSGKNLKVSKELSDVRIYPAYRMAYMEKTLWIENSSKNEWSQEEALFTFYLPEGAVASSLSLWINGKEEKSRLTTRKKATNAYKTIVGKERRDPVVLHWQEGNRLTATIFPCTPKEARRVKIGITAPLTVKNDQLVFNSTKVQGPNNRGAKEMVHVKILGERTDTNLPWGFKEALPQQYIYDGKALDSWTCSLDVFPLSETPFSFNQQSFQLQDIKHKSNNFKPSAIYLDINHAWNKNEIESIIKSAQGIPVFMYHDGFRQLKPENYISYTKKALHQSFSLFPIYEIKNPKTALFITKGSENSPIPSELKNSKFHDQLITLQEQTTTPIATIVLEGKKSPFISTLQQFKLLDCQNKNLHELVSEPTPETWFKPYINADNTVNIPMSGMTIKQLQDYPENSYKEAPSHLLRIYNYHKVMKEAGHLFMLKDADIPESVYNLCNEAFIVTPVSSLIVLETLHDYERFDIKENKNSLKNANLQDSGAVPEPHEWALIITLGAVLCLVYWRFK